MGKAITITDEFASAMQQLSAEASGVLADKDPSRQTDIETGTHLREILAEFRTLTDRIDKLERTFSERLEQLAEAKAAPPAFDFVKQFQKLDEQLAVIRSTETVNKRLFDSLHEELIGYRDNFLHESLQKPFIRDLVVLFDDLTGLSGQLRAAEMDGVRGAMTQPHENLENAIHSLMEILHRLEVKEIEPKEMVDRACHRVISYEPADFQEDDGRIVMRIKRGFLWRDRLLRPEEVIAKRFE